MTGIESTGIELIDTHIHLDHDRFDGDRDQVVSRAVESGVHTMIVPATTRHRWPKIKTIAEDYPGVLPGYGLHPLFLHEHTESDLTELEQWINTFHCCAIGECGLDRYCLKHRQKNAASPAFDSAEMFAKQIFYFEAQLNIAASIGLPVIVHARQAVEDVILSIKNSPTTYGVVHSFNGSLQQATKLIELGYRFSFGGAATHPRASKIRQLIKRLPSDSILIETDAPDQTGFANQGKRNEPVYLIEVLKTVAELRGESLETVARQCNCNANELFGAHSKKGC